MCEKFSFALNNKVSGIFIPDCFGQPFSKRIKTKEVLDKSVYFKKTLLYAIDGSEHTTNIQIIDGNDIKSDFSPVLLESGIDGVICTGLNDMKKESFKVRDQIGLILGIGDCASIIGSSHDGNTIFNIHAGYKGLLGFNSEGFGILEKLIIKLDELQLSGDDLSLYIGPMAGDNFEMPRDFIVYYIEQYLKKFSSLKLDDYFKNTDVINGEQKGNFNIRQLIVDVLSTYGFKNISFSNIDTNSENNNWPSYRLYSNGFYESNGRLGSLVSRKIPVFY